MAPTACLLPKATSESANVLSILPEERLRSREDFPTVIPKLNRGFVFAHNETIKDLGYHFSLSGKILLARNM